MTDDIDKLDGPELADAVAREVMGWDQDHWTSEYKIGRYPQFWRPTTDRNDAHRVLLRCEDLGVATETEQLVIRELAETGFRPLFLLTIDPSIICRAALRAVRAAK